MFDSILPLTPNNDEVIEITRKKVNKEPNPGYTIWGNGKTTRGGTSMDLLEIIKNLGKPEITLMQFMRDEMEIQQTNKSTTPNVIIPARSVNYTDYIKTIIKKHYTHMECLGIMKRVRRGEYMLNPRLYIPYKYKESMFDMWDSLEKKDCNEN